MAIILEQISYEQAYIPTSQSPLINYGLQSHPYSGVVVKPFAKYIYDQTAITLTGFD